MAMTPHNDPERQNTGVDVGDVKSGWVIGVDWIGSFTSCGWDERLLMWWLGLRDWSDSEGLRRISMYFVLSSLHSLYSIIIERPVATGLNQSRKRPVATGWCTKTKPIATGCMRFGLVDQWRACGPNRLRLRLRLRQVMVQKPDQTGPADTNRVAGK